MREHSIAKNQLGSNNYYDPTEPYRVVLNTSEYAYKNEAQGLYFVDRVKQSQSDEITGTASQDVFTIRENAFDGNATTNILSHQLNYYDGAAFIGGDFDTLGSYGLLVRSESLMVTPHELTAGYGSHIPPAFSAGTEPDWSGYPAEFVSLLPNSKLGYTYHSGTGSTPYKNGYYATGDKLKYDTQTVGQPNKGLVLAKRDVYNNETSIEYDDYHLLPIKVTDPGGTFADLGVAEIMQAMIELSALLNINAGLEMKLGAQASAAFKAQAGVALRIFAALEGALMDNTLLMEDGAVWDLDIDDPVKKIYDNIAPYLNANSRSASSVRKSVERKSNHK